MDELDGILLYWFPLSCKIHVKSCLLLANRGLWLCLGEAKAVAD